MVELIAAMTTVVIFSLIIYDIWKKASKTAASETKAGGAAKQAQPFKQDNEPDLQTELRSKPKADESSSGPESQGVNSEEIRHVEPAFDLDPSIKPTSNTAILETESRKRGHLTQDSVLKTEPKADESSSGPEPQGVNSEEIRHVEPVFDADPSIKPTSNTAILETESRKRGHLTQDSVLKTEPKADESSSGPEPQGVNSEEIQHVKPVFDANPSIKPTGNTTIVEPESGRYEYLPQDSMLRRHYLTHLFSMIESTRFSLPTDWALSRKYNAMIIAEMEECLSREVKMDQLVRDYEEYKKSLALPAQKPKAIVQLAEEPIPTDVNHENPKLPEDSMLRRHHLTYLRALVESRSPQCPTDFNLRRHYESMIENEMNKLL